MSKLERYLEFNWPALASRVDGTVEQKAIGVMRQLGKGLDRDSRELGRVSGVNDKLVEVLREAVEWDQADHIGFVSDDWLKRAEEALKAAEPN